MKKILALFKDIKKIEKRTFKLIIVCVLILILCITAALIEMTAVSNVFDKLADDFVNTKMDLSSDLVKSNILNKSMVAAREADTLANLSNPSPRNIQRQLPSIKFKGNFENVYFITNDGTLYEPDNTETSVFDIGFINENFDSESEVTIFKDENELSKMKESLFLICGISGRGYLVALCDIEDAFSGIEFDDSEIVQEQAIMDSKGNIIMSHTDGDIVWLKQGNFFNDLAENSTVEDFDEVVSHYSDSLSRDDLGKVYARYNGEGVHYFFKMIDGTNDFTAVSCVPEFWVRDLVNGMRRTSIIGTVVIMLLMAILLIYISHFIRYSNRKMNDLVYRDGLTGCMSNAAFVEECEKILKEKTRKKYAIICYDIANFSYINDGYGHERADAIIKELAEVSREAYGHDEIFARLNADNFVALVVDDERNQTRHSFIENQMAKAAKRLFVNYPIKIKWGRYNITDHGEDVTRMIDKANVARKAVDTSQKIQGRVYNDELMMEVHKKDEIESRMEGALATGEFVPYLQPKWDMEKNHICGAEALIRWKKPDGNVIPPNDFIPIFEQNGFIERVDFYMLEKICQYLRTLIDEDRVIYPVSVNQSRYLLHSPDYVEKVNDIMKKYDIPKGIIELELTETVFFRERDKMISIMNSLKEKNVELSIDDFGSGYSSLNILREIPFDVLKIDKEFLTKNADTDSGRFIIKKIIEMAEGLHARVICEGVETKEQVDMLLEMGCIYAQGFYYSKPISLDEFLEKYNTRKVPA